MRNQSQDIYSNPFSADWWRAARQDLNQPRTLVFAALMIAACVVLAKIPSIPVGATGAKITWGFLARSVCGMVCGPLTALVFGFAEDTISFLLHPTGTYFPGYALTTMIGTFYYAIFLYRQRVTVWKVFLAKLCTNILNVVLGALWSAILAGKAYIVVAWGSLIKNSIMLVPQTVMLCVLFAALLPILSRIGVVPREMDRLWLY